MSRSKSTTSTWVKSRVADLTAKLSDDVAQSLAVHTAVEAQLATDGHAAHEPSSLMKDDLHYDQATIPGFLKGVKTTLKGEGYTFTSSAAIQAAVLKTDVDGTKVTVDENTTKS